MYFVQFDISNGKKNNKLSTQSEIVDLILAISQINNIFELKREHSASTTADHVSISLGIAQANYSNMKTRSETP